MKHLQLFHKIYYIYFKCTLSDSGFFCIVKKIAFKNPFI